MTSRPYRQSSSSFHKHGRTLEIITVLTLLSVLIGGCYQPLSPSITQFTPLQAPTSSPNISATPLSSPIIPAPSKPTPSPTFPMLSIWLPPYLPEKLRLSISFPTNYRLATAADGADLRLEVSEKNASVPILWIYSLVAPFPTITDGITSDELHSYWLSGSTLLFNNAPLLMDDSTFQVFRKYWGIPATKSVMVLPAGELVEHAWSGQPAWAIIPFEDLEPRWKVLSIDGQSPLLKEFNPATYPLSIPFSLIRETSLISNGLHFATSNRDPSKLAVVAMTGVTAMVRATASTMELKGVTYPAQDIGSLLASADITHVSNEIPFAPDCPYPTPTMDKLVFCSSPKYIDLLKAIGTDIVELTGDHFMDYGTKATLYTLQMYQQLGWPYYGGGANAEEARQPVKLESNGNRIAFMGCNVGCEVKPSIPCDAIATDEHPGAAQCDYDWISREIPKLQNDGYQVIFTFQHNEYYTYTTESDLYTDFGRVAATGATIVSGSQAHQPHGFSFRNGAFIHYGLGNLFFDQYHYCYRNECDNAFIDEYVFYDGKHISTELITIHFVDYARPRLMTPDERASFLKLIFGYSDW